MTPALRPIVVTRLGVRKVGGPAPDRAWFAHRVELLRAVTWPSLRTQANGVAWVVLVDDSLVTPAQEALGDLTLEGGSIHLGVAVGFTPATDEIALDGAVHEGGDSFLTFRLDSDDALLPGTIERARAVAQGSPPGTLVDLPHGYQLDLTGGAAVETFYERHRQGPFLAISHASRATMLDVGGQHMEARRGRPVVRVRDAAWVQGVHGANVSNALWPRSSRQRLRRAGRGARRGPAAAREQWVDGRPLAPAEVDALRAAVGIAGTTD